MQLKFLETRRKKIGGCIYNPVRDKWAIYRFLISSWVFLEPQLEIVSPWKFTRKTEPESMVVVWTVFPNGSVLIVWDFSQMILL